MQYHIHKQSLSNSKRVEELGHCGSSKRYCWWTLSKILGFVGRALNHPLDQTKHFAQHRLTISRLDLGISFVDFKLPWRTKTKHARSHTYGPYFHSKQDYEKPNVLYSVRNSVASENVSHISWLPNGIDENWITGRCINFQRIHRISKLIFKIVLRNIKCLNKNNVENISLKL